MAGWQNDASVDQERRSKVSLTSTPRALETRQDDSDKAGVQGVQSDARPPYCARSAGPTRGDGGGIQKFQRLGLKACRRMEEPEYHNSDSNDG